MKPAAYTLLVFAENGIAGSSLSTLQSCLSVNELRNDFIRWIVGVSRVEVAGMGGSRLVRWPEEDSRSHGSVF